MELPFPDDWDGVSTCRWSVCWPDSEKWKAILYGLIESPMQGRFWDFSTGQFIPTRELFRPIYDYNFNLRRCFVACNDGEFQQLIDAIEGISIALSTTTGGDACCNGGFGGRPAPPTSPGTEGGTPPEGFEEPTDEMGNPIAPGSTAYQTRKCKVANMIHFQTAAMVDKILDSTFLTWTAETYGKLLTEFMLIALGYILGELSTPWPLIDGILGIVLAWQSNLLDKLLGETDMTALAAALDANETELVCALYNATSALQATNDYIQVLDDNGVSFGNREVILAIFVPRLVNVIFFKQEESEAMENAIRDYVGPVDCALCGNEFVLVTGTLSTGGLGESEFSVSSAELDIAGNTYYEVRLTTPLGDCLNIGYSLDAGPTVGCITTSSMHFYWICGAGSQTNTPINTVYPSSGSYCLEANKALVFRSCAPFVVTITRGVECV